MLKRLLREPLLLFLALALAIFAVYGLLQPRDPGKPDVIVVTAAKIEQLAAVFAKTWQRPPSAEELKSLIDDYVKEEIYVREALTLGLDKDDTVIRRRLRLKMEFMDDPGADAVKPTDAELESYMKAHAAEFELDPMIAFQQVFLNPDRHGEKIGRDTDSILADLQANASVDPATLGDTTLLPSELPLSGKSSVSQIFGPEFTETLYTLQPGAWAGPIKSSFGLHVVRVSERKAGRLPPLGEVRDAVAREWANTKRQERDEARFADMLKRYRVVVDEPSGAGAMQ